MNQDIRHRAAKILSLALEQPVDPANPFPRGKNPCWDSLKHVEVILMLEEEFKIRFTSSEVASLGSLDDIVHQVSVKHAS